MTNSNNGKITWKILKPIIQGKILFGPNTDENREIVTFANQTMDDMARLRAFFGVIETSIKMLRSDEVFRENFDNLLSLARSPLVAALIGNAVDVDAIEEVFNSIINDTKVIAAVETVGNIFDCFSVDRFVPVNSEMELEEKAVALSDKKLFYAGIYFTSDGKTNESSYKLRMEVDNSPKTIENKQRFWFPGPEGGFSLDMRYHRGFISMQNSIDIAIIKHLKKKQFEATYKPENNDDLDFSDLDFGDALPATKPNDTSYETGNDDDDGFEGLKLDNNGDFGDELKSTTTTTQGPAIDFGEVFKAFQSKVNISQADVDKYADDSDFWKDFDDDDEITTTGATTTTVDDLTTIKPESEPKISRKKRQLEALLGMIGGGGGSKSKSVTYEIDKMKLYTKQFPYKAWTFDAFKKGLYLAQAVQLCFFFALILQISSSVRQKIWFKESGNLSVNILISNSL